jgi:hypothetical protein
MTHRFLKQGRRTIRVAVSLISIFFVCRVRSQEYFVGTRGGAALDGEARQIHQAEVFGGILPWRWRFCSPWYARIGADGSVGWLSDGHENGFIGTIGPLVEVGRGHFPLTLELGADPTLLSKHHFPSRDFGDNFQFTSHLGLNWRFNDHFTIGVRVQHMSDGGITPINPGINMEMLTCRFNF